MKKIKLKKLRELVATLKAAWLDAIKGGKTAEEIGTAKEAYFTKFSLLETAEAEGKKDGDDVEYQEATKATDNKDANAAATLGDLKSLVDEASAGIVEKLKGLFPTEQHDQITLEGVKSVVDDALKAHQGQLDRETVKSIIASSLDEAAKRIKVPSKAQFGGGSGGGTSNQDQDRYQIEIPYGPTKGNLPLHMKQLLNCLLKRPMNQGIDERDSRKGVELGERMLFNCRNRFQHEGVKALTVTGTGTGLEWVPTDLSSDLQRRLYLASQIAQMYLSSEIQMPTDTYTLPISTTRPRFKRGVENVTAAVSTPGTGEVVLATKKFMTLVQFSYEAEEDMIVPVLNTVQTLLGEAAANDLEDALINGDTTSTHQDSDVTDPDDVRKFWMGWRKLTLAITELKGDLSTGGISRANLISLIDKLGKWGQRPSDLFWIAGTRARNKILGLDDMALWQNRGTTPTTATGTIENYLGIPIAVSEVMRENLNASGVYDGSTTTKMSILLVHKPSFLLGSRRDFTIEVDRNIKSQTNDIVASFRKSFKPLETPSASLTEASIGYNITA